MPLSLSKKASLIAQSDIRAMTLECAKGRWDCHLREAIAEKITGYSGMDV